MFNFLSFFNLYQINTAHSKLFLRSIRILHWLDCRGQYQFGRYGGFFNKNIFIVHQLILRAFWDNLNFL